MSTAQDILNSLHSQFGLTDTELGETLKVSREHISRLRHGKKNASDDLYAEICDLYTEISSEVDTPDQELQSDYEQPDYELSAYEQDDYQQDSDYEDGDYEEEYEPEVSANRIPWGLIMLVGVFIAGMVVTIAIARKNRKDQEREEITPSKQEISEPS